MPASRPDCRARAPGRLMNSHKHFSGGHGGARTRSDAVRRHRTQLPFTTAHRPRRRATSSRS
eukprot:427844-Prymnesium_polylepis.1